MRSGRKSTWVANLLILIGIFGRILPHPANFTPIGAISLVGGSKLGRFWRWTIPFVALVLSDFLLHFFYDLPPWSFVTPFIYISFAVNIFLGGFVQGEKRYLKLLGLSLLGSLQFFFISNYGVWMEGLLYSRTTEGLIQCYVMALPYLKNSLLGDLCWSFALFAVIERSQLWLSKRSLRTVSA